MSDLLYFNGINGATGAYGLAPMSVEELSSKIAGDDVAEYRQFEEVKKTLTQSLAMTGKTIDIVGILVESHVMALQGDVPAPEIWFETLAQKLSILILGGANVQPGNVRELANRLASAPVETMKSIVKWLNQGGGPELAKLLLARTPDNQQGIKEKLKGSTKRKIAAIQRELLTERNEDSPAVRPNWLRAFVQALNELPIESLKALTEVSNVVAGPLETLIGGLHDITAPNERIGALVAALTSLHTSGDVVWNDLVNALQAGLSPLAAETGQDVPWKELLNVLSQWLGVLSNAVEATKGVIEGVDPTKLDQAGWGIIFPRQMAADRLAQIQQALEPLLCLRLLQTDLAAVGVVGDAYRDKRLAELLVIRDEQEFHPQHHEYFKVYTDVNGYWPGDTADQFLRREPRNAKASEPANPDKVPYYLLLVGSPEEIPFQFQYGLDVQYAVGRIDFGDDFTAYENYARSVVAAEMDDLPHTPTAAFFGVRHPGDPSTELSAEHLVKPLYERMHEKTFNVSWQMTCIPPEKATKERLLRLMGAERPALLFTASHGLEFDTRDPAQRERQEREQGALLCGDWPAPGDTARRILPEHYLSGKDVREHSDVDLCGTIAFFFACYGAGTPLYDDYYKQKFKKTGETIAARPFIADLPKAMLSLPGRGALAVVGHIERTWSLSFMGEIKSRPRGMQSRQPEHIAVFESALERLLKGHPIGSAMDYFNVRYAALSTELVPLLDMDNPNPYELAEKWTAHNDARGYVIIGDPAVRLYRAQS